LQKLWPAFFNQKANSKRQVFFDCEFHIVPHDPRFDRLSEVEPAINDDAAKKRAKCEFFYTDSERELNLKRERRVANPPKR